MFAVVVFFADGFVELGKDTPSSTKRFFSIAASLPLDLQMTLCNRMFRSAKDTVPTRDSEPGFRWLARASSVS